MAKLWAQNKLIGIFVTVIFPAIIAIIIGVYSDLTKLGASFFWIPLGLFIILHCVTAFFYIKDDRLVHEVYHRAQSIIDENGKLSENVIELRNTVIQSYVHMSAALYWMPMLYRYTQIGFVSVEEFQENADELLSVIIEGRSELFGFTERELWNFACYVFDEERQFLVPVWRRKHDRLPSEGLGRSWAIGTGHVGKAFADNEAKITADATHETVIGHMRAPVSQRHEHDETVYRSFAAILIQIGDEGDRPLGILVGTSDVAGRFTKDNSLILYHAANVLAILIQMNHTSLREVLHDAPGTTNVEGGQ
jgi:hypothetical protein